jgi:excisionase family DNA binding protein
MRADRNGAPRVARHRGGETEMPQRTDAPLTLDEAASYLNVSQRFMRRLVAERRVVFYKVGKFVRFRSGDLDRLLETGRVDPFDERCGTDS